MLNEPSLGADKDFYDKNLSKILRRGLTPSYVKDLLGKTGSVPEIIKEIHAFLNQRLNLVRGPFKELKKIQPGYIDVNKPKKCPECNSKNVIMDYRKAEIFCADCGLVIVDNLFESGREELKNRPTSYGLLERDVISLYLGLSEDGFFQYGGKSIKEEMSFFLFNHVMWKYGEIASNIFRDLTCEQRRKVKEGRELYLKKLKTKTGETVCFPLFDKHAAIVNDLDRWVQSFRLPEDMSEAEKQRLISEIRLDACLEKGRELAKKQMKYEKPIRGDWLTLLRELYSIKYIQEGKEFLKRDFELQKIWGIPEATWRDKINLLASIDG